MLEALDALRPLDVLEVSWFRRPGAGGGVDWGGIYGENGFKPGFVADFGNGIFKKALVDDAVTFDQLLTFTRTGSATFFDSDGKLKWDAHNALSNSGFAGAVAGTPGTPPTNWGLGATGGSIVSVNADGVAGGNSVRFLAAVNRQYITQTIPVEAKASYFFFVPVEVYDAAGLSNGAAFLNPTGFPAGAIVTQYLDGVPGSFPLTVGKHVLGVRLDIAATAGTVQMRFGIGADGNRTGDIRFWAPRFYRSDLGGMAANPDSPTDPTYVPTTTAARFLSRRRSHLWDGLNWVNEGILLEGAATNLLTFCRDFTNGAWQKTNTPTITPGVGVGPDGLASGTQLTATVAGQSGFQQVFTATAANHTFWVLAEKGNTDWARLNLTKAAASTNCDAWFNFATGQFGTVQSNVLGTHKLRLYRNPVSGNDVWLIGTTVLCAAVSEVAFVRQAKADNDLSAAIADTLIVYWAEVELGSVSTSLKPSLGATPFARVADVLQAPPANLPWNPLGVSLAIEGKFNYADTGNPYEIISPQWGGGGANSVRLSVGGSGADIGRPQFQSMDPSNVVSVASGAANAFAPGLNVPMALASRHGPTFLKGAANGVLTADGSPVPTAMPNTSAQVLDITNKVNGHIRLLRVFGGDIADAGILAAVTPDPDPLFIGGIPGANFDMSDMLRLFQTDGVTPVSGPGQGVGLITDDTRGLVLGPELVTTGDFAADTDWTKNAGWTIAGGVAVATAAASGTFINQIQTEFVSGKVYLVEFTVVSISAGAFQSRFEGQQGVSIMQPGISRNIFVSSGVTQNSGVRATGTTTGTIDNISIREVLNWPVMSQPTAANQPAWGKAPAQVRNLCLYSEQQATGWVNAIGGAGVAPVKTPSYALLGGHLADRIQFSLGGGTAGTDGSRLQVSASRTIQLGELMTVRFKAKLVTGTSAVMYYQSFWSVAGFFTITDVEQTFSVDLPAAGSVSASFNFGLRGGQTPVNPNTLDVLITDFEFVPTALKALPYQRVGATTLDITEAGVTEYGVTRPDLSNDTYLILCPQAITGELLILGRNGSWFEPITVAAGGTVTIGPANTPGMPGMLRALGDIVDIIIVGKVLTYIEKNALMAKYAAKGAAGWLVEGPELLESPLPWDASWAEVLAGTPATGSGTFITPGGQYSGRKNLVTTPNNAAAMYRFTARRVTGNTAMHAFHENGASASPSPASPFTLADTPAAFTFVVVPIGQPVGFGIQDRNAAGFGQMELLAASVKPLVPALILAAPPPPELISPLPLVAVPLGVAMTPVDLGPSVANETTWALAPGAVLPTGMVLSAAGVVSGTPTARAPTPALVTLRASNASGYIDIDADIGIMDISWDFLNVANYTLNAGGVASMVDLSGSGYTLSQGVAASQPVYDATAPAGAIWDDSNDWLLNNALGPFLQTARYVVNWTGIVASLATDSTLWALNRATGNGWLQAQVLTTGRLRMIMRNTANATLLTYDVTTRDFVAGELITVSVAFHDALMDIYMNGLPIITDRPWDMSAQDTVYSSFSLGSRVTGGNTAASVLQGKIVAASIGLL